MSHVHPAWLALAGAIGMATMGVMSRYSGVDAGVITFYRLALGALFVLGVLLVQRQTPCRPRWSTCLAGALLAAFIVFYVEAMNYTTMANAILMVYLAPVMAAVAGHVFWQEYMRRQQVLCIVMALFGFAMVMQFELNVSPQDLKGLGFAAVAMLAYAAFMLLNRHSKDNLSSTQAAFWQLLVGGLVMFSLVGLAVFRIPVESYSWMLATGLIPGFLAIVLTVAAMQKLPTAVFGTLAYSEPVAVVIFGWSLFGEQLTGLQTIGCVIIVAAGVAQSWLGKTSAIKTGDGSVGEMAGLQSR